MKTLITIIVAAMLSTSCSKSDPGPQMGCMTGIPKGYTNRGLIRCCTQAQYLAGGNVTAGGIANFSDFTSITWTPTSDCATCK